MVKAGAVVAVRIDRPRQKEARKMEDAAVSVRATRVRVHADDKESGEERRDESVGPSLRCCVYCTY